MFERFTERAVNVVSEAQRLAKEMGCSEVKPEHLLLALVNEAKGVSLKLFRMYGVTPEAMANEVDKVQQRQLEVLSSHGLRIISVRKASSNSSEKSGGVKSLVMAVDLAGSWNDFRSALNNFEKQDSLVVITRLNLRSGSPVACNIEYAIYYK